MSNSYDNIYKLIKFTNSKVDYFEGTKKYISTGDSDDIENGQEVTFDNKPSRANVMGSAGDILIAKMANTNKVILLDNDTQNNIYSTGFYCLNSTKLFNKYLFYLLSNDEFNKEKDSWSFGTTQVSLNENGFKRIKINFVSDIIKQMKISKFLDKKVLLLDKILENQQQQIEKLKEYKQSLISEVVTKGLDPNVEFKDSGIEIIDKIPKDWGIIKMKYLGESRNGLTYNPSDMVDDGEGILVLRSSNVRDGKLIFDDNVYLKMQIKEDLMLKNGDILICSRNGSRDLIGKNAIIENVGLCSFGAFMMVFRVSKTNPKYIKYILDSFIFNYYLGTYLTATINQLTLSNFKNMKVIYTTNSDEQEKIISYLDEKCQKIDQLIELKAKKLLNLEEFKKSLIYEYVTGKKEVS